MSSFKGLGAMDLEKTEDFSEDREADLSASCSICLDLVLDRGGRSIAKLICGHEFHLDCIGSAFNAKGAMQCPNCRKVEKGRWLYANGHRSSADFDLEAWVDELYDLNYPELPFGLHWCPFRGITQLASLFEAGESQLSSYHESFGNGTLRDHSTASSSSSSHICPFMAFQGFPRAMMHNSAPSSAAGTLSENSTFPDHLTNLGGGQTPTDLPNSHYFSSTEPRNHNWQLQHSLPVSLMGSSRDPSLTQFGPRVSRGDASSHQRLGSYAHPHSLIGSGPSNRGLGGNHIYQHSAPSSSLRSSPVPPLRRSRPRGFTLFSSVAATASTDISGVYGFASVSGVPSRSVQEAESVARHFDHFYGWSGREGLTPLPWILDSESQWWGPFNPSQLPHSGGSFLQRPSASERVGQSRPENGYQRMPLPPRMPLHPRMPPSSYM